MSTTGTGRYDGVDCNGMCRHKSTYHTVRLPDSKLACARVDCPCMEYRAPPAPKVEQLPEFEIEETPL